MARTLTDKLVALTGVPDLPQPSGSLDPRTGETVVRLLFELAERRRTTLILVTHSESLAARCGRRLQLIDGRLIG